MCGIWFLLSKKQYNDKFTHLFKKIQHRGPDFSDLSRINQSVVMGFHRLSIMDLSSNANQPFTHKNVSLICNGEIYNYKEIKKDLVHKYSFKSSSDCEVILYAYLEYGMDKTIRMLDGVFAFVIHDDRHPAPKTYIGRDPLGVRPLFFGYDGLDADKTVQSIMVSSEVKSLDNTLQVIDWVSPGSYIECEQTPRGYKLSNVYYFKLANIKLHQCSHEVAVANIRELFTNAVIKRLDSDAPQGFLLSGGLDSSLVCGVASQYYGKEKPIKTFCIGMEGGTDLEYARQVSSFIGSSHTEILITPEQALEAIRDTVWATETFDITTIRASVGQYMVSRFCKQNTNIKVLYIGDGSDELTMGYLYFHAYPSINEAIDENLRLLKEIHKYDVLRADRAISHHGLEARVPFLDKSFVQYYLSLPPTFRVPKPSKINDNKVVYEKCLLREAFSGTNIIPDSVLWRKKEAFSDGVSKPENSWHNIIQQMVGNEITDEEFKINSVKYKHCPPKTKEAYYFRKLYCEMFTDKFSHLIPDFWMPRWCGENVEPSARALKHYDE